MMSHLRPFLRVAALVLAVLASAMAGAREAEPTEPRAPGSASGSSSPAPLVPTGGGDPYLPTGPVYFSAIRRPEEPARAPACSFRHPVCVHARRGVSTAVMLATLTELELASARLVDTLGLPAPFGDGRAGGSGAFDLYLVPPSSAALDRAPVAAARDEPDPASFD